MALLSFSVVVTCSRDAISVLDWWVTAEHWHATSSVTRLVSCNPYQAKGGVGASDADGDIAAVSDWELVSHSPQPPAVIYTGWSTVHKT